MVAKPTKKYRLARGVHMVPNPEFKVDVDPTEDSHRMAVAGDEVELTDDQFKAFGDKFAPLDSAAVSLRDDQTAAFDQAKLEALKTGQVVNPNQPKPTAPAKV